MAYLRFVHFIVCELYFQRIAQGPKKYFILANDLWKWTGVCFFQIHQKIIRWVDEWVEEQKMEKEVIKQAE